MVNPESFKGLANLFVACFERCIPDPKGRNQNNIVISDSVSDSLAASGYAVTIDLKLETTDLSLVLYIPKNGTLNAEEIHEFR